MRNDQRNAPFRIVVAIIFTVLGIRRGSSGLAWLGGLMVALGLGSIWPNWDAATRNALNATGANVWHWVTTAFSAVGFGTTSATTTLIILLIGVVLFYRGRQSKAVMMALLGAAIVFFTLGNHLSALLRINGCRSADRGEHRADMAGNCLLKTRSLHRHRSGAMHISCRIGGVPPHTKANCCANTGWRYFCTHRPLFNHAHGYKVVVSKGTNTTRYEL